MRVENNILALQAERVLNVMECGPLIVQELSSVTKGSKEGYLLWDKNTRQYITTKDGGIPIFDNQEQACEWAQKEDAEWEREQ